MVGKDLQCSEHYLFFSEHELDHVNRILEDLKLRRSANIILIDPSEDNKPSASKA